MDEAAAGEVSVDAFSVDAFLGGKLVLRQPLEGHRAGTDAVLLAAAVPADFTGVVADAGAGVGAAGLAVATRCPGAEVWLIENDPRVATLAVENVVANELSSRVSCREVDLLSAAARRAAIGRACAHMVITNPPFYDSASVRLSPDAGRRAAHVIGEGGLAAWMAACLDLLAPKGILVAIHRADAALALAEALGRSVGGVTLLPIYPRLGSDASRVLVRAVKGSRAPSRLAPALVLHESDGRFTREADSLHRGDASLAW